jgi:hypothetical protein
VCVCVARAHVQLSEIRIWVERKQRRASKVVVRQQNAAYAFRQIADNGRQSLNVTVLTNAV